MTNTIVRVSTRDGLEGIGAAAPIPRQGSTVRSPKPCATSYLTCLARARMSERRSGTPFMTSICQGRRHEAHSAIDIALWDLAAKAARLPLYRMLGARRSSILSYASTPLLPNIQAYLEFIDKLEAEGFAAESIPIAGVNRIAIWHLSAPHASTSAIGSRSC